MVVSPPSSALSRTASPATRDPHRSRDRRRHRANGTRGTLLARLHGAAATRRIPIIVVSGQLECLEHAWEQVGFYGSHAVLALPCEPTDLLALARDTLAQRGVPATLTQGRTACER